MSETSKIMEQQSLVAAESARHAWRFSPINNYQRLLLIDKATGMLWEFYGNKWRKLTDGPEVPQL